MGRGRQPPHVKRMSALELLIRWHVRSVPDLQRPSGFRPL